MRISAMLPAQPGGLGPGLMRWLVALGWWLLLSRLLRRGLRSALGRSSGASAGEWSPEPPIRPRRPKDRRRGPSWPAYPAAA